MKSDSREWQGRGLLSSWTTPLACLLAAGCFCGRGTIARGDEAGDRLAVERVYESHRSGHRESGAAGMMRKDAEAAVALAQLKAEVLRDRYGIVIGKERISAELTRIDTTTRAPVLLAEIKSALDGDTDRFVKTVVLPSLVDRELRVRFEADDTVHGPTRAAMEQLRSDLMSRAALSAEESAGRAVARGCTEVIPVRRSAGAGARVGSGATKGADAGGVLAQSSSYAVRAAKGVQSGAGDDDESDAFAGYPMKVQEMLGAQLKRRGDVSAVVESPAACLLYRVVDVKGEDLAMQCLLRRKVSFDDWLAAQAQDRKRALAAGKKGATP